MDSLLVHPQTDRLVGQFLASPMHALLLTGPLGSGKRTLAEAVAARLLDVETGGSLEAYPYFLRLQPPKPTQEISIEAVRQLIRELKLSAPGLQAVRRVVLVESADNMSHEAQNALLKMLEEPSSGTIFILTAPTAYSVLSTVASRTQQIYVRPVKASSAQQHYSKDVPSPDIEKAWQLSRGNVGLLQALLFNDQPHPLKEAVEQAKKLIRQNQYERLIALDQVAANKVALGYLLDALGRLLRALYATQSPTSRGSRSQKLLESWRLTNRLQEALNANANPKLICLELALNLKA